MPNPDDAFLFIPHTIAIFNYEWFPRKYSTSNKKSFQKYGNSFLYHEQSQFGRTNINSVGIFPLVPFWPGLSHFRTDSKKEISHKEN